VSVDKENTAKHINGFLHGISIFSSMFLNNGKVSFEAELITWKDFLKDNKEVSKIEFQETLLQWMRFGIIDRYANIESAFAPPLMKSENQTELTLLEATDDAKDIVMDQIEVDFFNSEGFRIYRPLEKIRSIEVLQDEFVFRNKDLILYLRCGWSD
jgi:hypothetical protein